MRRTVALLAFVTTSWIHVVTFGCVAGSMPSDVSESPSDDQAYAHAPYKLSRVRPRTHMLESADASSPLSGDSECRLTMACNLPMIEVGAERALLDEPTPTRVAPSFAARPVDVDLGADTPPPRRYA